MTEEEKKAEESKQSKDELDYEFIKFTYTRSNYYREIVADGIYGALTPGLDIHFSMFNQHLYEIKDQVYKLNPDGTLGEEVKLDDTAERKEQVLVREVEVGVTMSIGTAIGLIKWLNAKVKEAQTRMGEQLQEDSNVK